MNKKELIKTLKCENKKSLNKQIKTTIAAYDYLKKHKCKKEWDGRVTYIINDHLCACTHMNLRQGELEFMPFSVVDNIGTPYAGGTLKLEF